MKTIAVLMFATLAYFPSTSAHAGCCKQAPPAAPSPLAIRIQTATRYFYDHQSTNPALAKALHEGQLLTGAADGALSWRADDVLATKLVIKAEKLASKIGKSDPKLAPATP